jgi:hypothetical protein
MVAPFQLNSFLHRLPYRTDSVAQLSSSYSLSTDHRRKNPFPTVPLLLHVYPLLRDLHATVLSIHLLLGLPSDCFHRGFPTKFLNIFFVPSQVTCPAHYTIFNFTDLTIVGGPPTHKAPNHVPQYPRVLFFSNSCNVCFSSQ